MRSAATQPRNRDSRAPSRHCEVEGCHAPTRERKPFCSEHVLEHAYTRDLREILQQSEDELEAVRERGACAVNVDGAVVEEILAGVYLSGEKTWRRLCKDNVFYFNGETNTVMDAYLERMLEEKLVAIHCTKRGSRVVTLTQKGLSKAKKV